jgi:hypothetical protein
MSQGSRPSLSLVEVEQLTCGGRGTRREMGRRRKHWPMVQASRDEATLAVRLYNDPIEVRAFEGFVVHMHMAWLYLLHAEFTRDGVDHRYWQRDNPRRLEKIDGEPKRWELAKSVKERWPDSNEPVRANLEFFIGLRNKVEHRFAREQQALAAAASGQAQALLLNYEQELTDEFGTASSLATTLRFPVFIGSFTDEGEKALVRLRQRLPAAVRTFIANYNAGLEPDVSADPRYELRLRVFQELAKQDTDALAVQFTRYDDLTPEQREVVEELGRTGKVIVRERIRNVVGAEELRPSDVVKAVQSRIPFRFTTDDFQRAWKALGVRPRTSDAHPERTDERYCIYDHRHGDYGYKKAYVDKLVRESSTAEKFTKLTGKPARDKVTGAPISPEATRTAQRRTPDRRRAS